jgi:hypothetical protein
MSSPTPRGDLSLKVAILAALASLLGLALPVYRDEAILRIGFMVNDAVTLLLAVPLLFFARTRLVRLGALHYMLYNYGFYLFGAALNALFLLYVAIVALTIWSLVQEVKDLELPAPGPHRGVAAWMAFVALGLTIAWTAQWVAAITRTTPPERFDLSPEFVRVVGGMDLTLMVAMLVPGAVLLWRGRPWGRVLGTALNVSGALYNVVLAAGTLAQIRSGLAGAWPLLGLWSALGFGCFTAALAMLQPPLARRMQLTASR